MRAITERLIVFGLAAATMALLFYFGRLNLKAAILLGLLFSIIALWLTTIWNIALFKPYRLIIGLNYSALCDDFRLDSASSEFENFVLTALTPSLFARSDERGYSSNLFLYQEIPCLTPAWTRKVGQLTDRPQFFLRPARDGYDFGMQVDEVWWKERASFLDSSIRGLPISYAGEIRLGFLPFGYMPEHVKRWHETVSLFYPFDFQQRTWKKRLGKLGWVVNDGQPERIEHRYIVIHYYPL